MARIFRFLGNKQPSLLQKLENSGRNARSGANLIIDNKPHFAVNWEAENRRCAGKRGVEENEQSGPF